VLLVEDDDAVRIVLGRLLRHHGFEVIEATDPDEAVALVRGGSAPPDLLVTDVVMPHLSGPQLADRVRELYPSVPILFVSGYSNEVLSPRHLHAQDVAFLAKPFTTVELFEAVERLCALGAPPA
jgi:CheY-like chemotaxis protein